MYRSAVILCPERDESLCTPAIPPCGDGLLSEHYADPLRVLHTVRLHVRNGAHPDLEVLMLSEHMGDSIRTDGIPLVG